MAAHPSLVHDLGCFRARLKLDMPIQLRGMLCLGCLVFGRRVVATPGGAAVESVKRLTEARVDGGRVGTKFGHLGRLWGHGQSNHRSLRGC